METPLAVLIGSIVLVGLYRFLQVPARYLVLTGLVLLVLTAVSLASGLETLASGLGAFAFSTLTLSTILLIIERRWPR
jgi:hypothetical protein